MKRSVISIIFIFALNSNVSAHVPNCGNSVKNFTGTITRCAKRKLTMDLNIVVNVGGNKYIQCIIPRGKKLFLYDCVYREGSSYIYKCKTDTKLVGGLNIQGSQLAACR